MTPSREMAPFAHQVTAGLEAIKESPAYRNLEVLERLVAADWGDPTEDAPPHEPYEAALREVSRHVKHLIFRVYQKAEDQSGPDIAHFVLHAATQQALATLPVFAQQVAFWSIHANWEQREAARRSFADWLEERGSSGEPAAMALMTFDEEAGGILADVTDLSDLMASLVNSEADDELLLTATDLWREFTDEVPSAEVFEFADAVMRFGEAPADSITPEALSRVIDRVREWNSHGEREWKGEWERVREDLDVIGEDVEGPVTRDLAAAIDAVLESDDDDEFPDKIVAQARQGAAIARFLLDNQAALTLRGVAQRHGDHHHYAPTFLYLMLTLTPSSDPAQPGQPGRFDYDAVIAAYGDTDPSTGQWS